MVGTPVTLKKGGGLMSKQKTIFVVYVPARFECVICRPNDGRLTTYWAHVLPDEGQRIYWRRIAVDAKPLLYEFDSVGGEGWPI